MTLSPARQDAAWFQWARKLACLERTIPTEIRDCEWWRQGWQRLSQCLGYVRASGENLMTSSGRKNGNNSVRVTRGLKEEIQRHQHFMFTQGWQTSGKARQWVTVGIPLSP